MKIVMLIILAIFILSLFNNQSITALNNNEAEAASALIDSSLHISNFSVYYGSIVNQSIINELNNYKLVILQHWAVTEQDLSEIRAIKIAYIDLGEYDNSTYPDFTINLTGIVIGHDKQWGQLIVNVSSPAWINYTISRVKYDLSMGFNGVMFDDLDIVEQYPMETHGMVQIISIIHNDFPNLIIGVNRGFEIISNISNYIKFVLYEDFGTYYNFATNSYQFLNASEILQLENITSQIKSFGLNVLGLGYSQYDCSYYTYFDYQLGKELNVPIYTGNWNLSELNIPCRPINDIESYFNSYYTSIKNQAIYILSSQTDDGAIETAPSSNYIMPYVSNIAAIGLIKAYELTGNKSYINSSMKWLEWYSSHQNKNQDNEGIAGTIYDYEIVNGTEIPTYNYDSSDSYAATYLSACYDYFQATKNITFLQENEESLSLSLKAIFSTMNNNLTFAKPDYHTKYLMDNSEVYNGLTSAANLMFYLGNDLNGSNLLVASKNVKDAIISNFLINNSYFNYAVGAQLNFSNYYPDIMANYWPFIMNVFEWNSTIAMNVFNFLLNKSYYESALNSSILDLSSAYYSSIMGDSNITQIIINSANSMLQNNTIQNNTIQNNTIQNNTNIWNVEDSSWMIQSFFLFMPGNGIIVNHYNVSAGVNNLTIQMGFLSGNSGKIMIYLINGLEYYTNFSNSSKALIGNDQYLVFNVSEIHYLTIFLFYNNEKFFNIAINEIGLPSGTSWSVTFNGTSQSSSTSTIAFSVPNGTYSFTAGPVSGYTSSPTSGSINVNGANVSQLITFTEVTYTVTFTESGLPPGTVWYVNITGIGSSGPITSSSYTISLPNGTYSYTITTVNGNNITESSGILNVSGSNIKTTPITKTPSNFYDDLYAILAIVITVFAVLAIFLFNKRKK